MLSADELAAWYPVAAPYDDAADRAGHVPYSAALTLTLTLALTCPNPSPYPSQALTKPHP